ncbi:nischarin-like [Rhynchophorus ferrugineus]|uniref:nischarin-like n=1 Tax=Rhynchophorus ferrugineus TaxID=354439 RepID=UPI003FCD66EA
MASLWSNANDVSIEISTTEEIVGVTFYIIVVKISDFKWKVKHRYSEFYTLHNQLVTEHGVSKDILPSKKVIGTKNEHFIENRRKALEEYLQRIFTFLRRTMPKEFVEFLDFHIYDIYFLLKDLSLKCFAESDFVLSSTRVYTLKTLELHAINEVLKSPIPDFSNLNTHLDLGPILDLCSQLDNLIIVGSNNEYLQSNIIINKLPFDLCPFKIHKSLYLKNVLLNSIVSLGTVRDTLTTLKVSYCNAKHIADILQCDVLHKTTLEGSQRWTILETLDLSNNNLTEIDHTINLARSLKNLILDHNKISTISDLTQLTNLTSLSIEYNLITVCNDLHTRLGNVKSLNMAQNNVVTTKGFYKLYSLENLNLNCNKISDISELQYLGNLPCLENLILSGNNVAATVDYRVKLFEYFGDRASDICLDNEKPSEAELDKVSVLRALRIVKEGRTPNLSIDKTKHLLHIGQR